SAAAPMRRRSSVTQRSQSSSRSLPRVRAACRIASISACAVGSWSAMVRFAVCAIKSPAHRITQPTGTSPACAAACACASARAMKVRVIRVACAGVTRAPGEKAYDRAMREQDHSRGERVAKVIARAGLASRREAETWIAAGRVAVNGAVIRSPAINVTAHDGITVDDKALPRRARTRLFLFHKARGVLTSHGDPRGRPTLFDILPKTLPRL